MRLANLASLKHPLSIDTYKAAVAGKAVEIGAIMINDVWGLQKDPGMADAAAQTEAAVVITHNRGTIESADTLYGVSMSADAVSQVVSLKLRGTGMKAAS